MYTGGKEGRMKGLSTIHINDTYTEIYEKMYFFITVIQSNLDGTENKTQNSHFLF